MPDILSQFWAPLCAIGSHGPHGPNAQVCVSVFGASIVPERPRLLVVLHRTNFTHDLVRESNTLAITVLSHGDIGLLEPLGLRSGRDGPKLEGLDYRLTAAGDPTFGGAGTLACDVVDSHDLGDATAFLVAVRERETHAAEPLRWADAKAIVGESFLQRWAEKSAREREAARAIMRWRQ